MYSSGQLSLFALSMNYGILEASHPDHLAELDMNYKPTKCSVSLIPIA